MKNRFVKKKYGFISLVVINQEYLTEVIEVIVKDRDKEGWGSKKRQIEHSLTVERFLNSITMVTKKDDFLVCIASGFTCETVPQFNDNLMTQFSEGKGYKGIKTIPVVENTFVGACK